MEDNLLSEFIGMLINSLLTGLAVKRKWSEWRTITCGALIFVVLLAIKLLYASTTHSFSNFKYILIRCIPTVAFIAWTSSAIHFRYMLQKSQDEKMISLVENSARKFAKLERRIADLEQNR